ncbi:MAG: GAF domain-containing protein [Nitrospinae bacterium]|nr:GAF domain-containing protein [Nitrospinota bacterium]
MMALAREKPHTRPSELLKAARREKKLYATLLANANQRFNEKVKELSILRRIGDSISSSLNERGVCESLVNILTSEMTAENCSVMLLSAERGCLFLKAAQGQTDQAPRYFPDSASQKGIAVGEGVAGWVAKSGKPMLIRDTARHSRFKHITGGMKGISSLLCMPIKGDEGVLGVLNLSHPDIGKFSAENERLLRLIVSQAALAFNNIRLFTRIKTFNEELEGKVAERTKQLGDSERKYKSLMKQGAEGIVIVSAKTGKIMECNDVAGDLAGTKPEKLVGEGIAALFPSLKPDFQRIGKSTKSRKPLTAECVIYKPRRKREPLYVGISANVIDLVEERVLYLTFHDITQRLQLEKKLKNYSRELEQEVKKRTGELRTAQEELVQAAKLAALGQLASGVAHEINNPLAVIAGYAEDLKDRITNGEEIGKNTLMGALNMIIQSGERCHSITREILDFSKPRMARIEPHFLGDIVSASVSMAGAHAKERNVPLAVGGNALRLNVETDRNHLVQILINLINNAIDASPSHSTVKVEANEHNSHVTLSVTDFGHGIPKEVKHKIFDPFFSTKVPGKGTGLGLSITYQLVGRLHGDIAVESQPGKTAFTVTLPVKYEEKGK